MSDEPVYTGWLQTQLSGDIDLAKSYQREARRVLGAMLATTGVNDRLAAGEPTGFFKATKTLGDGTRITTWHNNGHNVARIETPPKREAREEPKHEDQQPKEWVGEREQHPDHLDGQGKVDIPPVPAREYVQPEEEEEKEERGWYMWVGVRSANPDVPWFAVNAVMIEPQVEGVEARGIVDVNQYFGGSTIEVDPNGAIVASDQTTFGGVIADEYNTIALGAGSTGLMQYGDHCAVIYPNDTNFFASANGLLGFTTVYWNPGDSEDFLPFDTLETDQTGSERAFGDRHLSGSMLDLPPRNWDVVFELDPDPTLFPYNPTPRLQRVVEILERDAGMAVGDAKVLPGDYLLMVNILDSVPELVSTRAGEVIPTSPLDPPLNQRSGSSDYDDYMRPSATTLNTEIEIEVRLNKDAELLIYRFATVIAAPDDRFSNVVAFGSGVYDDCIKEGGLNPFGPNWMATPIRIDVQNGVASWGERADVSPIFGGGTYAIPGDQRKELTLCVHGGYGVSQPDDGDWPGSAAYAAFRVLEEATAGIYGEMLFREWTEAELQDIFGGGDRKKVNLFNAYTGELQVMPVISATTDYDYTDWTDDFGNTHPSGYFEWLYWYYPYKLILKNQCKNSVAILIIANKTGYGTDSGQHRIAGPVPEPEVPDCC